jgi:hypothetical protein
MARFLLAARNLHDFWHYTQIRTYILINRPKIIQPQVFNFKYNLCQVHYVCYLMHTNMTSNYNEHAQTRTQIPFNWTTFPHSKFNVFMLLYLLRKTNKAAAWNYGNTNTKAGTKLSPISSENTSTFIIIYWYAMQPGIKLIHYKQTI